VTAGALGKKPCIVHLHPAVINAGFVGTRTVEYPKFIQILPVQDQAVAFNLLAKPDDGVIRS